MKETLKHREAFEFYYGLGETRSYQKVADHYGISKTSVYKWAQEFNWNDRVTQRDIEISKKLEKKTNTTVINEKARYRTIIRTAISDFAKRLNDKEIVVDSVLDLERLIKLDLLLMGEETERTEGGVTVNNEYNITQQIQEDEESRELFKQLYRRRMATEHQGTSED